MKHAHGYRKLGREASHRRAMLRGLCTDLVMHGRLRTTLPKAKELRSVVEKCVTRGKVDTVAARRQVRKVLVGAAAIKKLFTDVSPRFEDRKGGYTRIYRIGPRLGDKAKMALIEFIDYDVGSRRRDRDDDSDNKTAAKDTQG
ncbi:MAG: 50S ribosomal protein L17 [Pseudomonadota bacterium]|nr:50S ribosomal protein L17 [Pseudomonadota bacterium]